METKIFYIINLSLKKLGSPIRKRMLIKKWPFRACYAQTRDGRISLKYLCKCRARQQFNCEDIPEDE